MSCISVSGVSKNLDGKRILKGVNLEASKGEILALVGPSGSGKSTLLRCLNRLIEIDQGRVELEGKDIREYSPVELRRSVVLVHQESVMLSGTVRDNVSYGPSLFEETDEKHIDRCLNDSGLGPEIKDQDACKLSGGEKKRVALARALALRPKVLLLDEPTAGVDPKRIEMVERTIVDFSRTRELTVIWVTHNVEQAKRVSDRIANLKGGTVTELCAAKDFKWEGAF
jgi:putative ABC transport system ATP-binding protein